MLIRWLIAKLMKLGRYRHAHQQQWTGWGGSMRGSRFIFKKYEEDG